MKIRIKKVPGIYLSVVSTLYLILGVIFLFAALDGFRNGDKSSEKALFYSVLGISILLLFIIFTMIFLSSGSVSGSSAGIGYGNRAVVNFFLILLIIINFAGTIFLLYRYSSIIWLIVYIILSILLFIIICFVLYYDVNRVILKHEKYEQRKKISKDKK